jgi:DNA replication protein DnaC
MSYELETLSPIKKHWLLRNSNIPRRFLGLEPDDLRKRSGDFPEVITDWLDDAVNGRIIKQVGGLGTTGVGLLFDGGPGLGKTTHAVVSLMEFVRRLPQSDDDIRALLGVRIDDYGMHFRPVYYMTFPEFLSRKKALIDASNEDKAEMHREMEGFHGRAKEDWLNVRVLVLDDLGKEYNSNYTDASFDEILRARYDKALPTIITTNVPREDWTRVYKEAMGSFAYEAFHRVRIIGKDLRQT